MGMYLFECEVEIVILFIIYGLICLLVKHVCMFLFYEFIFFLNFNFLSISDNRVLYLQVSISHMSAKQM